MYGAMSVRVELVRQRRQIEALQSENSTLRQRLELMAGVIEELMKAHEDRK
jgi:hypothetical protein